MVHKRLCDKRAAGIQSAVNTLYLFVHHSKPIFIKIKTLLSGIRLLPVCSLLLSAAACDDDHAPAPEYRMLEGLNAISEEQRIGTSLPHLTHPSTQLYFYNDTIDLSAYLGSIATICPLSENTFSTFYYCYNEGELYSEPSSYTFLDGFAINRSVTIPLPDCNIDTYRMNLSIPVPADGDYIFYIKIENPEKSIYARTPTYRFSVRTEEPSPEQILSMFDTKIETIE